MIKSNYAYGLYEVGNHQFLNKTDALIEATKKGIDCHWNFHEKIYSAADWSIRPSGTLKELYRRRAQQIRDNYDYIIIHFSGGADSWTVLNSFLSNGIHVDEVYSRWAFSERKYKDADPHNFKEINLSSEYEFAAYPVLKEIEKTYPKTNIYIDDYSDAYTKEVTEQVLTGGNHYLTLGTFHRFNRKSPWEISAGNQGKRVAVIYGFDKIQCVINDGMVDAYFVDRFGGTDVDPLRAIEFFYWSPDMPEIPIMQAHDIKYYYETHNSELANFSRYNRNAYLRSCYPDYNENTFQVGKPIGSTMWTSETWIHKFNPRYTESWRWALKQFQPMVDKRFKQYYNDIFEVGYKVMKSKFYTIGKFQPKIQTDMSPYTNSLNFH
jgi:hypothetical protein